MEEHNSASASNSNASTTESAAHSGTVVDGTTHKPASTGELSSGATAGIGIGIGVGNVCCGPWCYCMPALITTVTGIILSVVWKEEKPKTSKTILTITLVTAGIALVTWVVLFTLGMAANIIGSL